VCDGVVEGVEDAGAPGIGGCPVGAAPTTEGPPEVQREGAVGTSELAEEKPKARAVDEGSCVVARVGKLAHEQRDRVVQIVLRRVAFASVGEIRDQHREARGAADQRGVERSADRHWRFDVGRRRGMGDEHRAAPVTRKLRVESPRALVRVVEGGEALRQPGARHPVIPLEHAVRALQSRKMRERQRHIVTPRTHHADLRWPKRLPHSARRSQSFLYADASPEADSPYAAAKSRVAISSAMRSA